MAFNKFMHPRNHYKDNKPDFKALAEKWPDFARHVITGQSGSATLDFHDAEALRSLTCTLLREDFGLEVELPLDRLIPTLPLRLNYIHWLEDLLGSSGHRPGSGDRPVWGIDIGCGASCIYPLLGAQLNGWHFLASEVDDLAIHYATDNIKRNALSHKITVVETTEDCMFQGLLEGAPSRQPTYHFTMCNPPFYSNALEAQGIMGSRSMLRPEPKSISTAGELEMIAEGGEVEFVRRMIAESLHLRTQVVWYTSMLGKKSSLSLIQAELRRNKIRNVTHTEFCQGRTMRWGIAWTFHEDVETPETGAKRRKLASRKAVPFILPVPDSYSKRVLEVGTSGGLQNRVQAVARAVHRMMEDLQMSVERLPTSKWCAKFTLTAMQNTWSHQRRKRRRDKSRQQGSADPVPPNTRAPAASDMMSEVPSASLGVESGVCSDSSQITLPKEGEKQQWEAPSQASLLDSPSSSSSAAILDSSSVQAPSSKDHQCEVPSHQTHAEPEQTVHTCGSGWKTSPKVPSNPTSTVVSARDLPGHIGQSDCIVPSVEAIPEQERASVEMRKGSGSTSQPPYRSSGSGDETSTSRDESPSDVDDGFPLELKLDVKLGDRRTIVVQLTALDAAKRNLLHQVSQFIKNQMKEV